MKRPRLGASPPPGNLFAGVLRLIFFNPSGFTVVGGTPEAFLSSLSPLIALLIVGTGLEILTSGWHMGALYASSDLCVILGQPVLTQLVARAWGREQNWLRYATAMNWCLLALPLLAATFVFLLLFFTGGGPSPRMTAYGLIVSFAVYALLLNVFLARHGLDLPFWRAGLLVVIVYGAIFLVLGGIPAIAGLLAPLLAHAPNFAT